MCNTAVKHKGDDIEKKKTEKCRRGILSYESGY